MTKKRTKKRVQSNGETTGGVTGAGFKPGESGNPGGRPKMPADLKAALAADSLELYEKAKKMLDTALMVGELKVASSLVLGLLKKTIPDTNTLLIAGSDGGPIQVQRIDPKSLSRGELDALIAVQKRQRG